MAEEYEQIAQLCILQYTGKAGQQDQDALNAWLDADAANRDWYEGLMNTGQLAAELKIYDEVDVEAARKRFWETLETATAPPLPVFRIRRWMKYVAMLLLLAGAAYSYYLITKSNNQAGTVTGTTGIAAATNMATTIGQLDSLVLPDGTKVWLNAASSLTYTNGFTATERRVRITGEVYFDVAKDKDARPFIVTLPDNSTVQALSTRFNINAYADEVVSKTTLVQGKLLVKHADKFEVLSPRQQANIGKDGNIQVANQVDIEQATAWKDGLFIFNNDDVNTVMRQLNRWYRIRVTIHDTPTVRISGFLDRSKTIEQILHDLEKKQLHTTINDKKDKEIIVFP